MKILSKNNPIQRNQLEMVALIQLVLENPLIRKIEAEIDFSFIYDLVEELDSEVKTDMIYRWFLGYGFHDKVPHFSTFGKNYECPFKDTGLFAQIFYRILK